jgi:ELWxxDGT repeat protein
MASAAEHYKPLHQICFILCLACIALSAATQPQFVDEPTPGAAPRDLVVSGDSLFFVANDGLHGEELWCLDHEEVPYLVCDLAIGQEGSSPTRLTAMNGGVAWLAHSDRMNDNSYAQIWYTEGDAVSTRPLAAFPPDSRIGTLAAVGSTLYFLKETDESRYTLWKSELSSGAQPTQVHGLALRSVAEGAPPSMHGTPHGLLVATSVDEGQGSELTFLPAGNDTDPVIIRNQDGRAIRFWANFSVQLTQVRDGYYLGTEALLYRLNLPSLSATSLLPAETTTSAPTQFAAGLQGLYFQYGIETTGTELWHTTGQRKDTQLVCDTVTGKGSGSPYWITPINGGAVFVASHPDTGSELWYTPGPGEAGELLKDLIPGPRGSDPYQLCPLDDRVLFSCYNDTHGEELWITDGTPSGTRLLKDLVPGPASSEPYHLTPLANIMYFVATTSEGEELWRSDGTASGTFNLPPIRPPYRAINSSDPRELTLFRDKVYFVATARETGRELWVSDGTHAGTRCHADLRSGPESANPANLSVHESWLYFSTGDNMDKTWWRVGEDPDSIQQVGAPPTHLTRRAPARLDDRTEVFRGWNPDTGSEPWIRDQNGREQLLKDLVPGPASSSPREFTAISNRIYFRANTPHEGTELFVTDGTADGTILQHTGIVYDSTVPNAITAFVDEPAMLVRHAGSYRISHPKTTDLKIPGTLQPNALIANGNSLFFVVDNPATGRELWAFQHQTPHNSSHIVRDIFR